MFLEKNLADAYYLSLEKEKNCLKWRKLNFLHKLKNKEKQQNDKCFCLNLKKTFSYNTQT